MTAPSVLEAGRDYFAFLEGCNISGGFTSTVAAASGDVSSTLTCLYCFWIKISTICGV
jgi:hypothetical protein